MFAQKAFEHSIALMDLFSGAHFMDNAERSPAQDAKTACPMQHVVGLTHGRAPTRGDGRTLSWSPSASFTT